MVRLPSLARRMSHYAVASVASVIGGLVSYPLFTRTLDVEDYGTMGLIQFVLLVAIGVAKLGLQNAIVRLWPEHEGAPERETTFLSSFLTAAVVLGAGVGAVCAAGDLLLRGVLPARMVWPMALAALLVPTRVLYSLAENVLRARERSRAYVASAVSNGALGLAACAVLVVAVAPPRFKLVGFYGGLVLGEGLVIGFMLRAALRGTAISARSTSLGLLREGFSFGTPLVLFELSTVTLLLGSRLVLEVFHGPRELGLYTAAYSLAWQVASLYARPIEMAALPTAARLFEREGPEAARAFLARLTRLYYAAAVPMIGGMWAVRDDLILVLASHKYRAAQHLVPVLTAGFLVFGARVYLGAGLYLHKRSRLSGLIALGGAALSVLLNLALVPSWGATGAAVGTSAALVAVVVAMTLAGRQTFAVDLGLGRLALYAAGTVLMVLAVSTVRVGAADSPAFGVHLAQLAARVAVGVAVYAGYLLIVEPEARAVAGRLLGRARGADAATPASGALKG